MYMLLIVPMHCLPIAWFPAVLSLSWYALPGLGIFLKRLVIRLNRHRRSLRASLLLQHLLLLLQLLHLVALR